MPKEKGKPPMLGSYRVLDLTDDRGTLCGKVLAELGADVIKVERPGGDPSRNVGPYYHDTPNPEKSLNWFAFNMNKRGITLNIASIDGQEIFKKLAGTAHFIIESSSPGYMDSLGLGYNDLSQINPAIILTSTVMVLVPPKRSNCFSWRTRRSLDCSGRGSSPISSRKRVPPSANSKRPILTAVAPVKAPFS